MLASSRLTHSGTLSVVPVTNSRFKQVGGLPEQGHDLVNGSHEVATCVHDSRLPVSRKVMK